MQLNLSLVAAVPLISYCTLTRSCAAIKYYKYTYTLCVRYHSQAKLCNATLHYTRTLAIRIEKEKGREREKEKFEKKEERKIHSYDSVLLQIVNKRRISLSF